jgi:hypothetical protein
MQYRGKGKVALGGKKINKDRYPRGEMKVSPGGNEGIPGGNEGLFFI